jgi:very-short-patch-repair endonuclease
MKISKRQFCIINNFEAQWLDSLIELGIVKIKKVKKIKGTRSYIEKDAINNLIEGEHYVVCPYCSKKMSSITVIHYNYCDKLENNDRIRICSRVYNEQIKHSEKRKQKQSETLKKRFQTSEGEITREQIKIASIKLNSDPEFLKKRSEWAIEYQNRPEIIELHRKQSKKMWSDPEFREKNKQYVKDNKEALDKSAARARKMMQKTSSVHLTYKEKMQERGLTGFVTEYTYRFYSIDEADPLAKIAVEVDGCYWHGCKSCGFEGNKRIIEIDKRKETFLKNRGWTIIRIKEHDIKKDPYVGIEAIKSLQERIREINKEKIKKSFFNGTLEVQAMVNKSEKLEWVPVSNFMQHNTSQKKMFRISTEINSIEVTEDHSLFLWDTKEPIKTKDLKVGDKIVGLEFSDKFEPIEIVQKEEIEPQNKTYDFSVPAAENFVLDSGILAHNSYSISGVSLDIEKSSKYEAMKDNFLAEWEKSRELIKRSIKIIKGLNQPRYGIGISSSLGPFSRPGTQSRRNFASGSRGGWS